VDGRRTGARHYDDSDDGDGMERARFGAGYGDYEERNLGHGAYDSGYGPGRARDDDRDWMDKTGDEVASWFGDDDAERRRDWDHARERERRGHSGRGPRAVASDDERVRDAVCRRMRDDEDLDASEIRVRVRDGEVWLDGLVDEDDDLLRADRCARRTRGVVSVRNLFERDTAVHRRGDHRGRGSSGW
jgi:osmotically-inducible protein OsmY